MRAQARQMQERSGEGYREYLLGSAERIARLVEEEFAKNEGE